MPGRNIFLNYRRDDTAGHSGRIFDRLNARFPGCVFRDVTGITYGVDFAEEIQHKINACDVLIVVIGPKWLTITDDDGRRRLDNEGDYVRLEVAHGLRRKIPVIPVLVGGARMPTEVELTHDMKSLARRHALEVTEPDFDHDIARLIRALERVFGEPPREPREPPEPEPEKSRVVRLVGLVAGAVLVVAAALIAALINPSPRPNDDRTATSTPRQGNQNLTISTEQANTAQTKKGVVPTPDYYPPPPTPASGGFRPVGSWLLLDRNTNEELFALTLTAAGKFTIEAREDYGAPDTQGVGNWHYDAGQQKIGLTGRQVGGEPFGLTLRVVEPHEGHFHADLIVDAQVKQVKMMPR